jgi:hypothetical protein
VNGGCDVPSEAAGDECETMVIFITASYLGCHPGASLSYWRDGKQWSSNKPQPAALTQQGCQQQALHAYRQVFGLIHIMAQ